MQKTLVYLSVFFLGFLASTSLVFFHRNLPSKIIHPNIEKNSVVHSIKEPSSEAANDSEISDIDLSGGGNVNVFMDINLAPISNFANHPKKLLAACQIKYSEYGNKNRYRWSLQYTLSKNEKKDAIEFYMQDEVFKSFSTKELKILMIDLLYCDPTARDNPNIKTVNIISVLDDTILSSYTKEL